MEFRQAVTTKFVHRVTLVGVDRFRGLIHDFCDANRTESFMEQHANPPLLMRERGGVFDDECRIAKTVA